MTESKYLAIDVGGTYIKYCILNKNAESIDIKEISSGNGKEEDLFNSLDKIISPNLIQIEGIAVSFPAPIDVEKGVVHTVNNFDLMDNFPLNSILDEKYSKRVWIENDANCSALAEYWKGNMRDVKSGVVITLGTGIGGGIILDGKLYRGIKGFSGEFSSFIDDFENPFDANDFSSIGNHRSLIGRYMKNKDNSNDIGGREFFEKYHDNDEMAVNALKDYVKVIAGGIINIQSILDVEKFCLGGGISSQDVLIKEIKESVHNIFISRKIKAVNEPKIEKCYFENAAGCIGALYNFLYMEKQI